MFEEFKQFFNTVFKKYESRTATWDFEQWRKIIYLITVRLLYII